METKVIFCICKHEDQDKRYGEQMQLHNKRTKNKGRDEWRCTVCGKEK